MNKKSKESYLRLKAIYKKYKLNDVDKKFIWRTIKPIFCHEEFQKRMLPPFYHHSNTTLGEHILNDTILVYLYSKKKNFKECMMKRTMYIALFHDLYERPWQENTSYKHLKNKHAFTHPIEAIINAITWFPDYFKDSTNAKIIIDGVLHHMYPCPVRSSNNTFWELNNNELYNKLDPKYKKIIKISLKSLLSNNFCLRNSFFVEGRILSKADKVITFKKDLKGLKAMKSFITCYNPSLEG